MHWRGDIEWWGWLLMSLTMVIFWGGILWLATMIARGASGAAPPRSPEDLLAERFARGEIDESDFRARRDALRSQPPDRSPRRAEPGDSATSVVVDGRPDA